MLSEEQKQALITLSYRQPFRRNWFGSQLPQDFRYIRGWYVIFPKAIACMICGKDIPLGCSCLRQHDPIISCAGNKASVEQHGINHLNEKGLLIFT